MNRESPEIVTPNVCPLACVDLTLLVDSGPLKTLLLTPLLEARLHQVPDIFQSCFPWSEGPLLQTPRCCLLRSQQLPAMRHSNIFYAIPIRALCFSLPWWTGTVGSSEALSDAEADLCGQFLPLPLCVWLRPHQVQGHISSSHATTCFSILA